MSQGLLLTARSSAPPILHLLLVLLIPLAGLDRAWTGETNQAGLQRAFEESDLSSVKNQIEDDPRLLTDSIRYLVYWPHSTARGEIASWLISHGARVDQSGLGGETALHRAVVFGRDGPSLSWVDFLLKRGADVNAKDDQGATPLLYVVTTALACESEVVLRDEDLRRRVVSIVELLLKHGASSDVAYISRTTGYQYPLKEVLLSQATRFDEFRVCDPAGVRRVVLCDPAFRAALFPGSKSSALLDPRDLSNLAYSIADFSRGEYAKRIVEVDLRNLAWSIGDYDDGYYLARIVNPDLKNLAASMHDFNGGLYADRILDEDLRNLACGVASKLPWRFFDRIVNPNIRNLAYSIVNYQGGYYVNQIR